MPDAKDPCRNKWCQNYVKGTEPYCSRCKGTIEAARADVEKRLGN
jgi:hypothetical protein